MIWLLRPDQPRPSEFVPAMDDSPGILPRLPSVVGKPVHVAFDGGQMSSDAGILLLAAVEQRLGIAERLANCIEDPRVPERVRHGLAEMIRYRALLIAAGYPDGNDCDALKSDPAFKMAVGRLPESGADLCLQPTISRLENLPGPTALKRMMAAMIELFCDSLCAVRACREQPYPRRSVGYAPERIGTTAAPASAFSPDAHRRGYLASDSGGSGLHRVARRAGSTVRQTRSAATANSAMPPKAGQSSAASSPAS